MSNPPTLTLTEQIEAAAQTLHSAWLSGTRAEENAVRLQLYQLEDRAAQHVVQRGQPAHAAHQERRCPMIAHAVPSHLGPETYVLTPNPDAAPGAHAARTIAICTDPADAAFVADAMTVLTAPMQLHMHGNASDAPQLYKIWLNGEPFAGVSMAETLAAAAGWLRAQEEGDGA